MFITKWSVTWKLSLLAILTGISTLGSPAAACGQVGDQVDGAIWRFKMTPKVRGPKPLAGSFRVSDNRVYQKTTPESEKFDKQVGTNSPNPKQKKATVTFTDLRGMDRQKNWQEGIKGKVLMRMKKPGEGVGTFIDSEGRHWNFHTTRIQE